MAKTKTETGIGYSPLTENVYLGKQNQSKGMWVGEKKDITQQFISTMFAYVEPNTTRTIKTGKEENIFMNVKKDKESIERAIKFLQKRRVKNGSAKRK